jgi:type IV pilus modification protein PilV
MRLESTQQSSGMRLRKAASRRDEGFTLVECTIALLIIMVAMVGVASFYIYAVTYNSGTTDRAMALAVAQQRMERLRSVPFTDASLNATTSTGTSETVTSYGHSFSVTTVVTDTNVVSGTPRLKRITITVAPQGGSATWARTAVVVITERNNPLKTGPYLG